jgi:hypothetical protein
MAGGESNDYVSIRQHTSAYVRVPADGGIEECIYCGVGWCDMSRLVSRAVLRCGEES